MKEAYTKTVGVDDPLSFSPAGARFSIGFVELPASSDRASIAHVSTALNGLRGTF